MIDWGLISIIVTTDYFIKENILKFISNTVGGKDRLWCGNRYFIYCRFYFYTHFKIN